MTTLWLPKRARKIPATLSNAMGCSPLSITDPVYIGQDEMGNPVYLEVVERSVLLGGEPGSGKSTALQVFVSVAALCQDVTRLFFFDAKQVELGMWRGIASHFIGQRVDEANEVLTLLQAELDDTYTALTAAGLRRVDGSHGYTLVVVDELALYTSVYGTPAQQKEFGTRLRDVVARGRAAGIIVLCATQRPSSDVVPTSLRDLFGYRWAFRTPNDDSSDVILGNGWSSRGWSAGSISPSEGTRGQGLLRGEDGQPRLVKSACLSDREIQSIAVTAADQRSRWASQQDTPLASRSREGAAA